MLFLRSGMRPAVISRRSLMGQPDAKADMFNHVDGAFAPINVYFSIFLSPFSSCVVRHVVAADMSVTEIVLTIRATRRVSRRFGVLYSWMRLEHSPSRAEAPGAVGEVHQRISPDAALIGNPVAAPRFGELQGVDQLGRELYRVQNCRRLPSTKLGRTIRPTSGRENPTMARKPRVKRVRKIGRVRKGGRCDVTRAEFDEVIRLLNERGAIINEIRRELHTQFTRIAQVQQELDDLKKRVA